MTHEIKYIDTRTGKKTIEFDSYFLHSKYDPIKEAQRIAEKEYTENFVHIVFGYGYGYIVDELKKLIDDEVIIVIDPFKEELNISDDTIYGINQIEEFQTQLSSSLENLSREIKVICSLNYEKIAPEFYKEVLQCVKDVQRSNQVDENTIRLGSESWQENYVKNLPLLIKDCPLTHIEKLKDTPVVIASGGPSLIKQLPLLQSIRNNIILVAAGSTINSLLEHNIEPDYVVTIDGSEANYHHFENISIKNAKLIYGLSSNYKIQYEWTNERYAFLTTGDVKVQKIIEDKYGVELPLIAGGGSVANFTLTVARKLSSGPIALIGQDLAYTNLQTHASGNKFAMEIDDAFLKNRDAFETEGYYEDKVMTDYPLHSMKLAFEDLIKFLPNSSTIFNCTEGGVKIKGFEQIEFKEFCEAYAKNPKVIIKQLNTIGKKWDIIHLGLEEEIRVYKSIDQRLKDIILKLKQDRLKKFFSAQTIKLLDNMDKFLSEKLDYLMFDRIADPLIADVLRNYKGKKSENDEEKFDRVFNQNLELYCRLQEAVSKTKTYTEEAIKLGDELNARINGSNREL